MKKGSTNWAPGRSCKDIRQSEASVGDGEFWIDPDASGNSVNAYCDMTTDEGKKNKSCKRKTNKHMLRNENSTCHCVAITITRVMKTRGHLDQIHINKPPSPRAYPGFCWECESFKLTDIYVNKTFMPPLCFDIDSVRTVVWLQPCIVEKSLGRG